MRCDNCTRTVQPHAAVRAGTARYCSARCAENAAWRARLLAARAARKAEQAARRDTPKVDNLGRPWPVWAKGLDVRSNLAPPAGYIAATCWCDRDVVWIAPADVGVTTASCGRAGCRPPSPATSARTS